jgi:hypothetical protein
MTACQEIAAKNAKSAKIGLVSIGYFLRLCVFLRLLITSASVHVCDPGGRKEHQVAR